MDSMEGRVRDGKQTCL
jgi:hypothetical protein